MQTECSLPYSHHPPIFPILILMGLVHNLPPCFLKIVFTHSVTRCASLAICYFDIICASLLGWSSEYSTTWCSVACSFLHPTYSPTLHSCRLLYCNATHFTHRQWQRLSITPGLLHSVRCWTKCTTLVSNFRCWKKCTMLLSNFRWCFHFCFWCARSSCSMVSCCLLLLTL